MRPSDYIARGWTQGNYAIELWGRGVGFAHPRAIKWCVFGALLVAHRKGGITGLEYRELDGSLHRRVREMGQTSYSVWQDAKGRTKREVLDLMRDAEKEVLGEA